MPRLKRSFFARPALEVSRNLLGKCLLRKIGKKILWGKIVETEAYIGPRDRASHAFLGKVTPRNRAEFMKGGHVYIYLVYGMYWQLNISTGRERSPECVLLRALEPIQLRNQNTVALKHIANGPGKLCRWLRLDKSFYAEDLTTSKRLWVVDCGFGVTPLEIGISSRIGIDYAGPEWAGKPWRFFIKKSPFVSR